MSERPLSRFRRLKASLKRYGKVVEESEVSLRIEPKSPKGCRKLLTELMEATSAGINERIAEERALRSPSGILQSSLPDKLGCSDTSASRLVRRLVKMGWLVREPVVSRQVVRTFKLSPDPAWPLRSVEDIPCFCCSDLGKCGRDMEPDPVSCRKLNGWLRR